MRNALLLSGLQRNAEPFIENQLKLLVDENDFDIFIVTSSENSNRIHEDGHIRYIGKEPFTTPAEFFYDSYGPRVRDVFIDIDDSAYNHYAHEHDIPERKFHTGLLKSYFKVYRGLRMIHEYEKKNSISYDTIVRARLDSFLLKKFSLSKYKLSNMNVLLSESNGHKDDSCLVFKAANSILISNFFPYLVAQIKSLSEVDKPCIEDILVHYIKSVKLEPVFITDLICRIGCPTINFRDVPYFNKDDIAKISSLEYKIFYE